MAGVPLLDDQPAVEGRRLFVPVDFDVPRWPGSGALLVEDDFGVCAALPTSDGSGPGAPRGPRAARSVLEVNDLRVEGPSSAPDAPQPDR